MATTLGQLKTAVIHKLGLTSDDGMLDDLTLSINSALKQMSTEFDWPWLVKETTINTVAGTTDYALPSDATRIRELIYRTDPLTSVQYAELVRYNQSQGGEPALFYIQNSTIKLAPIPDGVYAILCEYVCVENTLTSDSNTILCPTWYDDIVVTYAAIEEARRTPDVVSVRLNALETAKAEWIQRIKDNVNRNKNLPDILTRNDW